MQFTRPRLGLVAAAAVAAAALAAPSVASAAVSSAHPAAAPTAAVKKLTPAQLASASKAAFVKASSVRVRAIGVATKGVIGSMDVRITPTSCDGTFNLGTIGVVHLRRIGTDVWFTGNDALWKTAGVDPVAGAGKWAQTTTSDAFWLPVISLCYLPIEAELALPKGKKWVTSPAAKINKVATLGIRPTSPAGTIDYVAASGTHLIQKQVRKGAWALYQEWNAPVTITAPDPATILA